MPKVFFNEIVTGIKKGIADVAMDVCDIPGSTYTQMTAEGFLGVASSVDTDKTQIVTIKGVGHFYNQITEEVLLNGQTKKTTVNKFFRVNSVTSNMPCVGDIYVFEGNEATPVTTKAVIAAGNLSANIGVFTVPDGFEAKLQKLEIYVTDDHATVVTVNITADNKVLRSIPVTVPGSQVLTFDTVPLKIASKSDIKVTAVAETGDATQVQFFATFEFEQVPAVGAPTQIMDMDWIKAYTKTNAVTSTSFCFVNSVEEQMLGNVFNALDIIGTVPAAYSNAAGFTFTKDIQVIFDKTVENTGLFGHPILFQAKGPLVTGLFKVTVDGPLAGTYFIRPEGKYVWTIFKMAHFSNASQVEDRETGSLY